MGGSAARDPVFPEEGEGEIRSFYHATKTEKDADRACFCRVPFALPCVRPWNRTAQLLQEELRLKESVSAAVRHSRGISKWRGTSSAPVYALQMFCFATCCSSLQSFLLSIPSFLGIYKTRKVLSHHFFSLQRKRERKILQLSMDKELTSPSSSQSHGSISML